MASLRDVVVLCHLAQRKEPKRVAAANPLDLEKLKSEFHYATARSGGSGGQHVNKVETKVIVKWNVHASQTITKEQRRRLLNMYAHRIDKSGDLSMYCQATRYQLQNKLKVTSNLIKLIQNALVIKKKRKPTQMSQQAKNRIKKAKSIRSEVKKKRMKPRLD